MTTHLAFPRQHRTECMRKIDAVATTEVVGDVTCATCLRRYLQRLALMRALRIAKDGPRT